MINSLNNPRVKAIKALQKSRERRKKKLFIIEGLKEIEKAISAGYYFESIYYCEELITFERIKSLFNQRNPTIEKISNMVYDGLVHRENSGGIIACTRVKELPIQAIRLPDQHLVLVIESVEKPGNLGALLRTADASGVDAVIICDPHTDLFNPNVIRSGVGCLFTVPLATATFDDTLEWLKSNGIKICCAALNASKPYYEEDFKPSCAIVMGTESTGLSAKWLSVSDENIIIPMHGTADSMNVSTSAAVIIFEAIRQRNL